MLTIGQTLRFFSCINSFNLYKSPSSSYYCPSGDLKAARKGSTSTEIVYMGPESMLLTTTAWQQWNKDPAFQMTTQLPTWNTISNHLQLQNRLLSAHKGNTNVTSSQPSFPLSLGSRITRKNQRLERTFTSNTKATLWSSTGVPTESSRPWLQLFIPLAVKPHTQGQDTIVDFPFVLFYCVRRKSKSSFQFKITVFRH